MAIDREGGTRRTRRPSMKGTIMQDVSAGVERSRIWPVPRAGSLSPTTKRQNEKFRKINEATKYWPAFLQAEYRRVTHETPLLPRDLMVMVMYNRFSYLVLDDGRKIYPMTAVQDVSASLDVLSQLRGSMIYRGEYFWQAIPIGTLGQVLTLGAPDEPPSWQEPAAKDGLTLIEEILLVADTANFTFAAIPQQYRDLLIAGEAKVANASTSQIGAIQFNGGLVGAYTFSRENHFGHAEAVNSASCQIGSINANAAVADAATMIEMTVPGYSRTNYRKMLRVITSLFTANSADQILEQRVVGYWNQTPAVTSIKFILDAGNWKAGTRLALYGRG